MPEKTACIAKKGLDIKMIEKERDYETGFGPIAKEEFYH